MVCCQGLQVKKRLAGYKKHKQDSLTAWNMCDVLQMSFIFPHVFLFFNIYRYINNTKAASRKRWEFVTSPRRTLPDHTSCFIVAQNPSVSTYEELVPVKFCIVYTKSAEKLHWQDQTCFSPDPFRGFVRVSSWKLLPKLVCTLFFDLNNYPHLSCHDTLTLLADVNVLYDYMVCIWEMHCNCIILKPLQCKNTRKRKCLFFGHL